MSDTSDLDAVSDELGKSLKSFSLNRVLPFTVNPRIQFPDEYFSLLSITYKLDDRLEYLIASTVNTPGYLYFILTGEGIGVKFTYPDRSFLPRRLNFISIRENAPAPVLFLIRENVPVYLKTFYDFVKERWKNSWMFISDELPYYFNIDVQINFSVGKNREETLRRLASFVIQGGNVKDRIKAEKIIQDREKNFKIALDEIINLSEKGLEVNFSYCLACGKILEKDRLYCPRSDINEPQNCLNKLNYRIKARLGVNGKKAVAKKRDELYEELQRLIEHYPLYAFEEFKNKHEDDLFNDGRKN